MTDKITRIAMWSGPRNISTAMMYAFANRPDCWAWDEPFYATYLKHSRISHPLNDKIIAAGETDWDKVCKRCLYDVQSDKTVFYQKHMTHHMMAGFDRSWINGLSNAFLIRRPERVLISYAKKRAEVNLHDIGFIAQTEIFDQVAQLTGSSPAVVDTDDILANPEVILGQLCARLGIAFNRDMLAWSKGAKAFDGVWAPHWYNAVWQSTGFGSPNNDALKLSAELQKIADQAQPYYAQLQRYRLQA